MSIVVIVTITIVSVVWFIIGYFVGKTHERIDWNRLIRMGKISRPYGYKGVVGGIRWEESDGY